MKASIFCDVCCVHMTFVLWCLTEIKHYLPTIYLSIYIFLYLQQGNPSYCVSMFIPQACFVGVDPPLVRNLHSHTGCSNGNCSHLDYLVVKAPTRSSTLATAVLQCKPTLYLSPHLSISMPIYLSIYLSVRLSIYQSINIMLCGQV